MTGASGAGWRALLRAPGPELAACELTHLERVPIDIERAREQHAALASTLEGLGAQVTVLPPLEGHGDACFVEDGLRVHAEAAILTRPGALSRRAEVEALEPHAPRDRARVRIEGERATLDGGDLVLLDDLVLCGQSTRTNHAGLKELAHALLPHGLRVKAAPVRGALHLQTAATRVGPETLLVQPEWVDLGHAPDCEVLTVDGREPFGANALQVGEHLLVPAHHPRAIELLQARGYAVVPVEVDEFAKAEGCITCLVECWQERPPSRSDSLP